MTGRRHSSHPPRPRASTARRVSTWIAASAALVGMSLLVSVWLAPEGPERYSESRSIAQAMLEDDEEHVWPPITVAPLRPPEAPVLVGDADAAVPGHGVGSPLHPPPPSRPGFEVREGERDGIHYFEAVLGHAAFEDELPIVVVLHGRGGYAQIPGGPFHSLSHPIRLLVPQAPDPLGSGFQWIPVYVNQGLVDEFASTLFATTGRLARLIRDVSAERGATSRPIVTGFSQGGIVTLALALYHDDVVGAALPMSSWLPPPLEPTYRRTDLTYPIIRAMHGEADRTVPITKTRELFARLSGLDFDVELATFEGVGHETNSEMNALFHEWLEETVCRAAGDDACARAARHRGQVLTGDVSPDAGLDGAVDGSLDGALDGAAEGGLDGALPGAVDAGVADAASAIPAREDEARGRPRRRVPARAPPRPPGTTP